MHKALYRTYRSKSLDEIVGQDHVTAILKRAIATDKIAHAYLLTGPRGVGKTSIARILAHAINGLPYDESNHLDIIEIDAASNNSVEDVRDLRERVQIAPTSAKRKVYIIDEVHMLSKQAFNALLKTLEEPPEHIVFILATTDADKLPATILSRVQRFNFRAITPADATRHLVTIAKKEKIDITQDALALIATHGRGSFRDSISLLDQLQHLSDSTITAPMVQAVLGLADEQIIELLLSAYISGDIKTVINTLDSLESTGTPLNTVADQLIHTVRNRIYDQPQLLTLLDNLTEVSKSAWPGIRLLTALTAQASTPPPATNDAKPPKTPVVQPDDQTPDTEQATGHETAPATGITPDNPEPKSDQLATQAKNGPGVSKGDMIDSPASTPFAWAKFLGNLKDQQASGAAAILNTCSYNFDGTTLTIYAGKKFNKSRLSKAMPQLIAALNASQVEAIINILDTPKPPADATTAAIIDIMGGGEEIDP